MANEKLDTNNPEDVKVEAKAEDKVSNRRAFTAGLATLGTAALLGGKAEAGEADRSVKNKILDRIKSDMKSDDNKMAFAYLKVGGQYAKGVDEIENVNSNRKA
jgi:hypothetical protein